MARRNVADTLVTIETIKAAIFTLVSEHGLEKASYTAISNHTGISRTGISHHFPSSRDIYNAVKQEIETELKATTAVGLMNKHLIRALVIGLVKYNDESLFRVAVNTTGAGILLKHIAN